MNSFHEGCADKSPNNIFPNLGGNSNATSNPSKAPTAGALESSNEVEDFLTAVFQDSDASPFSTAGVANTSSRTQLPSPRRPWFPSNSRSQHVDVEAAHETLSGSVPYQTKSGLPRRELP